MKSLRGCIELVLIASATVYGIRAFYYAIFPWVLKQNTLYPLGTLTPWIEAWNTQRDGAEIYALYIAMFLSMATVLGLFGLFQFVRNRWARLLLLAFACVCLLSLSSGITFTPPSELVIASRSDRLMYCGLFGLLILTLLHYQKRISLQVEALLVAGLLILLCIIPTSSIGSDVIYSFAPAQKLLDGVALGKIYFQYDFLLSSIAALWTQSGLKISQFILLTKLSLFLEILGIFLLSRSLFRRRSLSLLLLIAIVVIRIVSAPWDPAASFQQSPLRLDLWLILIVIIYFVGPAHWLLPLSCGLLLLVHGNFGLIHTLAYLQLVVTLSVLSILDFGLKLKFDEWKKASNLIRVASISGYLLSCFLIARINFSASLEATSLYQKVGIGFMPMDVTSFFWTVPVVISVAFSLLWVMRKNVTPRHAALGFALIYFAVGNCIYFFGRSHELNLFAISTPIIFVLFFALDLLDRRLHHDGGAIASKAEEAARSLALVLGLIFILAATYKCADQIRKNLSSRFNYVGMTAQPHEDDSFVQAQLGAEAVLKEVRGIVGSAGAIRFMMLTELEEFSFYSLEPGNKSFSYPLASWIFLDDLMRPAQSVVDENGYLLFDERFMRTKLDERIENVGFRYVTRNGRYVLIAKTPPNEIPAR